jgi:hypothetical protein
MGVPQPVADWHPVPYTGIQVVSTILRAVSPMGQLLRAKRRRGLDLRHFGLCACCCATLAGSARAQQSQSSQSQPSSSQQAPAQPVSPFVPEVLPIGSDVEAAPGGWKRILGLVNKDEEGLTPRAGSVVAGGGFALGGHWRQTLSSARLDTEYMASIKGYQSALLDLSSHPLLNGRVVVGFGVKYDSLPQEDFFGLGPASEIGTHASYERQGLDTRAWARIRVRPWFELRPVLGHLDTRLLAGEQSGIPSIETVSWKSPVHGVGRQSRFLHAGLTATIDRRDDPRRTRAGYLIRGSVEHFNAITVADRSFVKTEIDARGYVPIHLLSDKDVFAVRGVALLTDGTRHESAPFYFLPRLGGGGLLRGYETSRFVDTQALLASAEYRWQAHRRLQIVSIVDVGQVAPAMRAFTLSNVQTSVGVGLRYRGLRIDYARGSEGGRFHVGVGTGF